MITGKIKKWGNSLGLIIPKNEANKLNLKENQEVVVDVVIKTNPLKELFGFNKNNKISRHEFLEQRKMLESKFI